MEESPGAVEAERDGVGAWETGGSCVVATGSVIGSATGSGDVGVGSVGGAGR